jgi:hypothetical protein
VPVLWGALFEPQFVGRSIDEKTPVLQAVDFSEVFSGFMTRCIEISGWGSANRGKSGAFVESLAAVRRRGFYLAGCYEKSTFLREGGFGRGANSQTRLSVFVKGKIKAYLSKKIVHYYYF